MSQACPQDQTEPHLLQTETGAPIPAPPTAVCRLQTKSRSGNPRKTGEIPHMAGTARQSRDWVAVLAVPSELCSDWLISLLTGILQGLFSKMRKNGDF